MVNVYIAGVVVLVVLALAAWYFTSADPAADPASVPVTQGVQAPPVTTTAPVPPPPPTPVYAMLKDVDHNGDDLNGGVAFPTMEQAKAYCDVTPECRGYSSRGWVKRDVSKPQLHWGNNLYVKQ